MKTGFAVERKEEAMSDLIYKQDAVTLPVMPKRYRKYQTNNLDDAYEQGWEDLQKCIERLPSAQPQRKSGQLLYHHTENIDEVKTADVYFCSSCKKEVLKKIRFGMFSGELDIQYDYCPHCGADMRGESE